MSTIAKADDKAFSLEPKSFQELEKYAKLIADSELAPKDYKGKPGNVMIAIQMGFEIGLKPMQAIQNIAVINGRPCVWGDALLAIVKAHPDFEDINEFEDKDGDAVCAIKRRGQTEVVRRFGNVDAKAAGLLNKQGPWTQYPQRMKQMRARGFAVRDAFPDAIKGLNLAEEVRDYAQEKDITPSRVSNALKDLGLAKKANVIEHEEPVKDSQDKHLADVLEKVETFTAIKELDDYMQKNASEFTGEHRLKAINAYVQKKKALQESLEPTELDESWEEFTKGDSNK